MLNLLQETKEYINSEDLDVIEIFFIGKKDQSQSLESWDDFAKIADFEYDDGYGGQIILSDLIIAFSDGTVMERGEYDGSEWWKHRTPFKIKNLKTKPLLSLEEE